MKYKILRPPLLPTFELPSREELLEVKKGQNIKLLFTDIFGRNAERMWVKVTNISESGTEWKGKLKNTPFGLKYPKYDDEITFHPLDIISLDN